MCDRGGRIRARQRQSQSRNGKTARLSDEVAGVGRRGESGRAWRASVEPTASVERSARGAEVPLALVVGPYRVRRHESAPVDRAHPRQRESALNGSFAFRFPIALPPRFRLIYEPALLTHVDGRQRASLGASLCSSRGTVGWERKRDSGRILVGSTSFTGDRILDGIPIEENRDRNKWASAISVLIFDTDICVPRRRNVCVCVRACVPVCLCACMRARARARVGSPRLKSRFLLIRTSWVMHGRISFSRWWGHGEQRRQWLRNNAQVVRPRRSIRTPLSALCLSFLKSTTRSARFSEISTNNLVASSIIIVIIVISHDVSRDRPHVWYRVHKLR